MIPDTDHRATLYGRAILLALQLKPTIFAGTTANPRRRAKNRVALVSRRTNR